MQYLVFSELVTQGQDVNHVKDDENIIDRCKLLVSAAKEKTNILHFVIFSPYETLVISNFVSTTLATKVNKIFWKIPEKLIDGMTCMLLNLKFSSAEKANNM